MSDVAVTTIVDLGSLVESWLFAQPQSAPENPPRWLKGGHHSGGVSVRSSEHLTVLVASLDVDRFGVLVSPVGGSGAWGQTMRTDDGWLVEVHAGTDEDFAQRVYRGEVGDYPCSSEGTSLLTVEVWTPIGVADVLWAWLGGALPDGCSRTLRYLSAEDRRRYGLA